MNKEIKLSLFAALAVYATVVLINISHYGITVFFGYTGRGMPANSIHCNPVNINKH